jgi:multiple sugar transport system permease protein
MESLTMRQWQKWTGAAGFLALVIVLIVVLLFPIIWMVLSSLKTQVEISAYPPSFLFMPTFHNYQQVFTTTPFIRNTVNSLVITFGALLVSLALGLPAAYGIARFQQRKVALVILLVRMFPFITFLIPWFQMFQAIGLTDTHLALIATHLVIILPLIVWVTMGFFEDIPVSYDEAAMLDGCGPYGVFFKVALPLAKPGIVAASVLSCIFSWNNLMFALVLGGQNTKTLPVAIQNFMSFEELQWGQLCAVATLITLPIIIIVLFLQKYLVKGLASGGLKG